MLKIEVEISCDREVDADVLASILRTHARALEDGGLSMESGVHVMLMYGAELRWRRRKAGEQRAGPGCAATAAAVAAE